MSRKVRSRNKRPGAKQLRILEKYKEIVQAPFFKYEKSKPAKEFRKMTIAKREVERWKNLLANTDLNLKPLEIRKIRDKMFKLQTEFISSKASYYQANDRRTIQDKYASQIREKMPDADIDDILEFIDEQIEANRDIINELTDRLENYMAGDRLMTDFYHKYGFDSINDSTVYAFGVIEGYIVQ
jgi:hypothetical protein